MDAWWALLLVQTIYIDMSSCSRNKYVYQVPSNCKILSEETSSIYRKIASQSLFTTTQVPSFLIMFDILVKLFMFKTVVDFLHPYGTRFLEGEYWSNIGLDE